MPSCPWVTIKVCHINQPSLLVSLPLRYPTLPRSDSDHYLIGIRTTKGLGNTAGPGDGFHSLFYYQKVMHSCLLSAQPSASSALSTTTTGLTWVFSSRAEREAAPSHGGTLTNAGTREENRKCSPRWWKTKDSSFSTQFRLLSKQYI